MKLHNLFKGKATLHIIPEAKYGYLKVGRERYYFHSTDWAKPYEHEIDTFGGKQTELVIPYDGWEKDMKTPERINQLEGESSE